MFFLGVVILDKFFYLGKAIRINKCEMERGFFSIYYTIKKDVSGICKC